MRYIQVKRIRMRLEYKQEDMWIGVYWRDADTSIDIWLCMLPCLPIHINFWKYGLSKRTLLLIRGIIGIVAILLLWYSLTGIARGSCAKYEDCEPYKIALPLVSRNNPPYNQYIPLITNRICFIHSDALVGRPEECKCPPLTCVAVPHR